MKSNRVVLISCTTSKRETGEKPIPACQLYTGSRFEKKLRYAELLHPDMIFILSGEHGVVELDKPLKKYDHYLGDDDRVTQINWAKKVLKQLRDKGCDLQHDEFIILAGEKYYRDIISNISHFDIPMQGVNMYHDQSWLNERLNNI